MGNILTTDNLQKRRIIILDWCCMCSQMVSRQIVCLCTAQLLRIYGIWLLFYLEFLGLCLQVWWIFYNAGLADWVNPWLEESGMGFPIVSSGVYGVREMQEHLKGEETSIPALKFQFLQTLFNWLKASQLITLNSLSVKLDLCSVCL